MKAESRLRRPYHISLSSYNSAKTKIQRHTVVHQQIVIILSSVSVTSHSLLDHGCLDSFLPSFHPNHSQSKPPLLLLLHYPYHPLRWLQKVLEWLWVWYHRSGVPILVIDVVVQLQHLLHHHDHYDLSKKEEVEEKRMRRQRRQKRRGR